MKTATITCVLIAVFLSACDSETGTPSQTNTETGTNAAKIIKDESASGLAIGTDIKGLIKSSTPSTGKAERFQVLEWNDLIPADYDVESMMAKYESKLMVTTEGSPEEIAIYKLMKEEFSRAPPNTALHAKTVKIPGFVAPLDETNGIVGEFLLVPYFGSCIHAPPPPVNQTILVNPQEGRSIAMSKIRRPVWVVGELKVERSTTDLAEAGYRIENARLEVYR